MLTKKWTANKITKKEASPKQVSSGLFFAKTKKEVIVMAVAVNYKEKLKNKDLDIFFRNANEQNAEEAMS